jgi:molybdopterin-containing oxidoreductase family iron-sulfur binding subunit
LRTTDAPYYATGHGEVDQKNGYKLVQTQNHYSMEGRALVREGTLEDYNKNPEFARKYGWMLTFRQTFRFTAIRR